MRKPKHREMALPFTGQAGRCRLCGNDVKPPRRTWCGEKCVHTFMMTTPSYYRKEVRKRDKCICAECNKDCRALKREYQEFYAELKQQVIDEFGENYGYSWMVKIKLPEKYAEYAALKKTAKWIADHIVPLIDGGSFDLSNLQTLCYKCNITKTFAEATERAARRRKEKKD